MVDVLVAGLVAGIVATLVMTVFQWPASGGSAGSTAAIVAKFNGQAQDARLNQVLGWTLHFVYGTFWGVAFAWGLDAWQGILAYTLGEFVLWGLVLGLGLFAISQTLVTPMAGMTERMDRMPTKEKAKMGGIFLVLHFIYGTTLAIMLNFLDVSPRFEPMGVIVPWAGVVVLLLGIAAGFLWQWRQLSGEEGRATGAS